MRKKCWTEVSFLIFREFVKKKEQIKFLIDGEVEVKFYPDGIVSFTK